MRTTVAELGGLLEQWLEGVDEVEIRQEENVVVVVPVADGGEVAARLEGATNEAAGRPVGGDYQLEALLAGVTVDNLHGEIYAIGQAA